MSTGVDRDQPNLIDVVAPGASARRVAAFRGNTVTAVCFAVAAYATAALTWWMLWYFDQSLSVHGAQSVIARAIEVTLAALTVTVPWYGTLALSASLRANRLAAQGHYQDARMAVEDSQDRIWVVVGIGLTALVVAFLSFLLAGNDGSVRHVLLNYDYLWRRSHVGLVRGFWLNIRLFVVAELIVLPWSLLVAVVRLLPGRACTPVRWLAIAYIDVFRGIPAIITIYLIGFGFSLAGVPLFKDLHGTNQLFWLAILALVLVYGAYVAEVYRAGLESVHWSQTAAARSLGLSQWQTLRHVVIPQAVRRIIPPLLNDFVALQKDTALVSIVGLLEVLNTAQQYKNRYFNLSPVTGAALCFLVITIPFTRFVDYLVKRDRARLQAQT
jgi:polar amino acid transport system permease protein